MVWVLLLVPLPAGVALYAHVGGSGGAAGGWQSPSQSTMYSTYTKLPSYALSLTSRVAFVTNVYVLSSLTGSGIIWAQSKVSWRGSPAGAWHSPWIRWPLTVVLTTYSSTSS